MENEQQTELTRIFINTIAERFETWNEAQEGPPDFEKLIKYLIGCSLIEQKQIRRFLIVDQYPKILEVHKNRKLRTVYSLENITGLKTAQVYSILKHFSKTFRYNKNLLEHEKATEQRRTKNA